MSSRLSRRELLEAAAGAPAFLKSASFSPGASTPPGILTFRHIHLDFHTSPAVTGVGEEFNAEEFARVLKEAAVNSVTIFGKCHHGMSYYPTRVGVRHPNLKGDLVGGMIEACHRQGIRVPVYISTLYDQRIWREHADWRALNEEGRSLALGGPAPLLQPQLGLLCINTPYLDYVLAQVDEVLCNYEADGIFYDNFSFPVNGCFGPSCMLEREKLGLDSARPEDRQKHAYMIMERTIARFAATVRARKPNVSIYTNGPLRLRQSPKFLRNVVKDYTHVEIESLPGGRWGYSHFQMASRYLRNFGLAGVYS